MGSKNSVVTTAGIKTGLLKEPMPYSIEGPPFVNRGENLVHPVNNPLADFFDGVSAGDQGLFLFLSPL
jgi:hypothetical protein